MDGTSDVGFFSTNEARVFVCLFIFNIGFEVDFMWTKAIGFSYTQMPISRCYY